MAVTKLSALLQEVTTKKKIFEKKVLCRTVMPSKYIYIYVYIYIYIYIRN